MREITAAELRQYLDLKPDGGCRLNRRIYTDPDIFELEMEAIWERSWVYLGHESQLRNKGDFLTTTIGRQSVVVSRDLKGRLAAFINVCRHRGATLCRLTSGNTKVWTCPYHGWAFGVDGELLAVKEEKTGAYPPSFEKRSLGLTRVPHIESYRGLIFANLDPEAAPLRQQLGDVAVWIDLLIDQSPEGWEVLNGVSTYVYHGNWKLQVENGVDGYHATTVHWNFNATLSNREASNTAGEKIKAMKLVVDPAKRLEGGLYQLENGSTVMWRDWLNPEDRFNYVKHDEFVKRKGAAWTKWAIGRLRNVLIYPNLQVLEAMSTQLRVIKPITVDKTAITVFGFAPVGEDKEQRRLRIRAYEDFFNASGMATPDDLAEFNYAQQAYLATRSPWSDLSRGALSRTTGPDSHARELGITPLSSGSWTADEGGFVGQYQHWLQKMVECAEGRRHA